VERAAFFDRLQQGDTQPLSLGQYRLLDELGRGGMGRVYKALHTIMGRVVAIKVISPELVSDPVAVEWFRREVRASTQLNHPNIVMAYDANEAEGMHFLVMEYVHGRTLETLVRERGPLPIAHAVALMRQAALALQHAHDKGMVHRDIKPSNLLIPHSEDDAPSDALVKILDFGLARLQGKTKGDTIALRGEAGVLGTPDYIAPEQSRDIHSADIRSDLYSLGCVLYFALAGRVPFPGDNAMEKLVKHLMEQPEPVEKARPGVPPQLADIVRRLMAKEPAQRYQTPAELVRELDKVPANALEEISDASRKGMPTSVKPLWISPPTRISSHRPPTAPQPEYTRILDNVDVFAHGRGEAEVSGPSLLEPVWKHSPDEQHRINTHDTLTLSRAESSPNGTGEAPAAETGSSPVETLPPIDAEVFRLWRRWLKLLETIVAGRGPSHVNGDAYQTIHTLLLQACRAAIDACPVAERRAFYEECLSIARPWLKLQTFVHTDADMLDSLLWRSRQIEVELNGGKAPWTIRQVLGLALLASSPAGAALWYVCYGRLWLPSLFRTLNEEFSLSSLSWAWSFLLKHPALLMGVIFPLVIIVSIVLLSRTQRT
jgi:serine/threonine protein kinase